jgi:hypothetical protein
MNRGKMFLRILILSLGVLSSVAGAVFNNQASVVFGAIIVCTPFIQESVDEFLGNKWFEAAVRSIAIAAFISACVWALGVKYDNLGIEVYGSALWFIVFGAGMIQLLWILLIRP